LQPPWWQTLPTTIATNHEIDNVEGIYGVEGVKEKVMERELEVKNEKQNYGWLKAMGEKERKMFKGNKKWCVATQKKTLNL
jgi:hypothetical protein